MDEVAIYIWLDGVLGTSACFGLLFTPGEGFERVGDPSVFPCASEGARLVDSERAVGTGGGNGEIDMEDTLAVWAW